MNATSRAIDATAGTPASDDHVEAVYSKVSWRIMPLLVICYIIAYLDRINIGYAQLQMKQTLPFSDAVYGLGAGIFFIGYFLFEVPSNLMLEKIGARKTLLRIMFCWGIVATGMMFVQTPTQFYVLRFLLGAFEAGFFPGMILYMTYWYPPARRGQMIAIFMTATTVAGVIAGPLCGGIMKWMDGVNGWHGWQWLFLVQGLPASVLGIVAFFYLQDKPEDAHWLDAARRRCCATISTMTRAWCGRRPRLDVADAEGPEGLHAVAGVLPAARRDLHDGVLAADADQELGHHRPVHDRHLLGHPERLRRHRHGADRPQFRHARRSGAGTSWPACASPPSAWASPRSRRAISSAR